MSNLIETCLLFCYEISQRHLGIKLKDNIFEVKSWTRCIAIRREGESFPSILARIGKIHSVLARIGDTCRLRYIYLYQSCYVVWKMMYLYYIYNDHPYSPSYIPLQQLRIFQTVWFYALPSIKQCIVDTHELPAPILNYCAKPYILYLYWPYNL
jgi:hypothetical protein